MARPKTEVLTEREAQIMSVLWDLGEASSDEVRVKLPGSPHDSSVRTMLRVLVEKRLVKVNNAVRPAVYRAAIPRSKMRARAAASLLKRFFSGSAEELVQHLLDDEQLTPEQLAELKRQYGSRGKAKKSEE